MTAASPFVQYLAPLTTAAQTPPSGMDVDTHEAGLDEHATPLASDQDIQLTAEDSPPLVACQGAAATQQTRLTPRKKPAVGEQDQEAEITLEAKSEGGEEVFLDSGSSK